MPNEKLVFHFFQTTVSIEKLYRYNLSILLRQYVQIFTSILTIFYSPFYSNGQSSQLLYFAVN